MQPVINSRTAVFAIVFAAIGIVFNTTRTELTGTELYLWVGASIVTAVLLAIVVQYAWMRAENTQQRS